MAAKKMRTIIHVDMDCFYAAIEVRDRPELHDKPVAVGGARDRRGVLTTCNYEARRFGVGSAMPTFLALQKCPHLIVLPTRFEVYREEAKQIRAIFREYTDAIEPLSLDEAFLDVSGDPRGGGRIAAEIRRRIFESRGLTASAGIAPCKTVAKVASDWRKPNGQFEVKAAEMASFLEGLPVRKLRGVGPVAAARLERLGVTTCAGIQKMSPQRLHAMFGRFGHELYELARGIDRSEVEPDRLRKSMSTERTFPRDLPDLPSCLEVLPGLIAELEGDLAEREAKRCVESLFVKLKFTDFSQTSVERGEAGVSLAACERLVEEGWERARKPVRLIGIGVRFGKPGAEQLPLPLGEL